MIAISTYSGECDGLGYAAELAGIEVAAYCEADPKRRAKLTEKHPGKTIFESDEELTSDAIKALGIHADILFGGPPCQPFSSAGAQRGTADPRHRWPEMLRFIREYRPRWVVVENVGNFVNLALDLVWSDLEGEGYETGAIVLPALAVGAPHRRDRCFVVGYSNGGELRKHGADGRETAGEVNEASSAGCVADSDSERLQGRGCALMPECSGERIIGAGDPSGMANAESNGRSSRRPELPGFGGESEHNRSGMPDSNRAIKSRLGRVLDVVSNRLDGVRWPAWRGQEQHAWEPPRTVRGMKDRPRRIESLGLAVVPWQAYPIFALIAEIDRMMA